MSMVVEKQVDEVSVLEDRLRTIEGMLNRAHHILNRMQPSTTPKEAPEKSGGLQARIQTELCDRLDTVAAIVGTV